MGVECMSKLEVIENGEVTQEFPMSQELVNLGREKANDLCLSDHSVSRYHATIKRVHTENFIEDTNSKNGTYVNGVQVNKHLIKDGDYIEIGNYLLHYWEQGKVEEDLGKTVVISSMSRSAASMSQAMVTGKEGAKVRFLSGTEDGEERVVDQAVFTIGHPGGDLILISQRHTGHYLLKMGGCGTPSINSQPAQAGGVKLQNGDRIQLGKLDLEFIC